MSVAQSPMVSLRFTARYRSARGFLFMPGEVAGFDDQEAEAILLLGVAEREPTPPVVTAPHGPERDKMVRSPLRK